MIHYLSVTHLSAALLHNALIVEIYLRIETMGRREFVSQLGDKNKNGGGLE